MTSKEQTAAQKQQETLAKANEPKTRCLVCKFETSPKMRCICLPASAGDEPRSQVDAPTAKEAELLLKPTPQQQKRFSEEDQRASYKSDLKYDKIIQNPTFNLEIINDLILRNLLVIENHSDIGVFKVHCNKFKTLDPIQQNEVQKFFSAIVKAHGDFLHEQKLQDINCPLKIERNFEKNMTSLQFSTLNPHVYDGFMRQLKQRGLLPQPKPFYHKPTEATDLSEQQRKKMTRTPFNMAPKPKGFQE